jgi:hypothetical protein
MKPVLIALLFCYLAFVQEGVAQKVTVEPSADWQRTVLNDVYFTATTRGVVDILGRQIQAPGNRWIGFVVFSCSAPSNLGKRILWVDAEVKFSNGYTRKFKGIQFGLLQEGEEFDVHKIPFETDMPVSVSEVKFSGLTIK